MKRSFLILTALTIFFAGLATAQEPAMVQGTGYPIGSRTLGSGTGSSQPQGSWAQPPSNGSSQPQAVAPQAGPNGVKGKEKEKVKDKDKDREPKDKKSKKEKKSKKKAQKVEDDQDETEGEDEVEELPVAENLSPVERFMAEASQSVSKTKIKPQPFSIGDLSQFGYSFFTTEPADFDSLNDIPVGPEYLVGPGDRLILTVWGSIDGVYEMEVNRSGEVVLPKVGAVHVAGQPFGQLPTLFKATLGRVFKDFRVNVNMGKLRLINVFVVGEVAAPGQYQLNSLSTVINALSAAGGPSKSGTLRNIKITRNGKVVEQVDLYDFFLKGDKGRDIRLQPGDTVLVPVIGPVAGVAGNVRRPAIYELKGERSLKELLALAGGINPSGYLQRVRFYRVEAHEKKIAEDFNLDVKGGKPVDEVTAAITLQDHDLVEIFPIDVTLRDYVRLEGHVLRPGDYALKPGARVSSLLKDDNLLPDYFGQAGQIIRLCPPDYHQEVLFLNVDAALKGDPASDLLLKEFDQVKIFSRKQMEDLPKVKVNGEVQKPGEYKYYPNMTVRDLLMQAGNPKLSAFLRNAEISRLKRTGESVWSHSISIDLGEAMRGNPDHNLKLEPLDELNVRRIPNWADETERYVNLKGEFVFPGRYPVYKGERLSSVIKRAGGFSDKAFLPGAKFTRVQVRELQQKRMDEILARTEMDLAKKESEMAAASLSAEAQEASKAALEGLRKTVEYLKQKKAEGRLVIKFLPVDQMRGSEYDLEAQGGDEIEVPSDPKMVSVYGQVYNPSSFVHLPGQSVGSYLKKSGGATRDADQDDMYLIKADGSVESRGSSDGIFNRFVSKTVDSGDSLVVPQRVEKIAWMRDLKDIATILGQLAITAGVIVAAGL